MTSEGNVTAAVLTARLEDEELSAARLERLAVHGDAIGVPALASTWKLSAAEVRAVQSIHEDAASPNTDRSYTTARRYWHAWHQLRYRAPLQLPVSPQAVLRFIVDHVRHWDNTPSGAVEKYLLPTWIEQQLVALGLKRRGAWSVNTIEHRVSVLSSMHDETRDGSGEALPNPCRDPYVVRLLRAVRKAHAQHDQIETRRDAATKDVLQQLIDQCDATTLRGIRDIAVLLVGFNSGGRRRSEISALRWERLVSDGDHFLWKTGQTKTSDGKDTDVQKPIQGPAAQALRAWRDASGVREGPVFREIGRDDRITERPMSDQAVYRLVKRLAAKAELAGAWGAHSLRAGFLTQAGRDGTPLAEAMELSDHSSVLVASRYYRTGAASTSPAANLADGISLPTAVAARPGPAMPAAALTATSKRASKKTPPPSPPQRCFQLHIELQHVSPPVWRRVWIRAEDTFEQLHWLIAAAMGWQGEHLYRFDVGEMSLISPHAPLDADRRADGVQLGELLHDRMIFGYAYDFGDDWYHHIEVIDDDPECTDRVPVCEAGSGACPPEDVGGPDAYELFKRQAKARRGDLYRWHREQGGPKGWNPMIFSLSKANAAIQRVVDGFLP
jgi:integrase